MTSEVHQHAIENGVIQHLSVSQVKTYRDCARAWAFDKVFHEPRKSTKSQEVGTEGHSQLEHFGNTGEDVLGPIAAAGKHLLDAPLSEAPGLILEAPLEAPALTAAGLPFVGFIDVLNLRYLHLGVIGITDYKFTASIEKYAASARDLITTEHEHGIQMLGYARWAFGKYPGVQRFDLQHIYFQTRGKKEAKTVRVQVPASAFDAEWSRVERLAEGMTVDAKASHFSEVKPNWSACEKYGGCSFKSKCFTYQSSPSKGAPVSLMSRLASTAAGTPPPAANPRALAAAPEEPKPAPVEVAQVLPPDAPASKPELASEKPAATEPVAEKKTRGRPKKSVAVAIEPERLTVAEVEDDQLPPFFLYVDAIPNGEFKDLSAYVAEKKTALEKANEAIDIRCAPERGPLGFGKWKGMLAAVVKAEPPKGGVYVLMSGTSEVAAVVAEALQELLAPFPGAFVKGVR